MKTPVALRSKTLSDEREGLTRRGLFVELSRSLLESSFLYS